MKYFILSLLLACTSVFAEDRIKVAIVDTGISKTQATSEAACKSGHQTFVGRGIYDNHGHGTNIFSIIAEGINTKTHCIVSYKFWYPEISGEASTIATINALRAVRKDLDIRYLNLSLGGPLPDLQEKQIIESLLVRGVTVVAAAGNESNNLDRNCNYFPACYRQEFKYENFRVVEAMGKFSNYGSVVTDTFSGIRVGTPALTGTSQATAQKMASILKSVVYSNRGTDDRTQSASSGDRGKSNYR